MTTRPSLPLFTLLLMISFASVNAIMFTPALPDIATYFSLSHDAAQMTISWFLIGYAAGQLVYGPLANRYGRKPALYAGICLQIVSSLLCAISGLIHEFPVLIAGRLLLALGSGVGLKMTFTLVSECYEPKAASKMIATLILAFAITPGLSAALGGVLNEHFGWMSCFYAGSLYGVALLLLTTRLPETLLTRDVHALEWRHLIHTYGAQFHNKGLIFGAMMMGASTCFVYTFAAIAPFVAINLAGMTSTEYGFANLIPSIGLVIGSLISAKLTEYFDFGAMILGGISIASIGVAIMLLAAYLNASPITSIFIPMMVIYLGLSAILANASAIAMSHVEDKAHGSAVMNFINMGLATLVVLGLGFLSVTNFLMPVLFALFGAMLYVFFRLSMAQNKLSANS